MRVYTSLPPNGGFSYNYQIPLIMNKDRFQVELLDRVQTSIENQIYSYEVEEIEDIFNEEDDEINRAITFNRGTKNDCVIISPNGEFKGAFGDELSPEFLMGLANSLIRSAKERVYGYE